MTLEDYLAKGGTREEKLVVLYQKAPERLSPVYRGIVEAFFTNSLLRNELMTLFPNLEDSVTQWENGTLQEALRGEDAEFLV